eukprot:Hpha_TRINITY_DN1237_c0_g1::TRINITY_DN1237_c0_g1_i1::g.44834::m.44834/K14684/SLC25A23S; solute carrier family 25 (mitochondrial phosphate transporter), member 23/24/25/41
MWGSALQGRHAALAATTISGTAVAVNTRLQPESRLSTPPLPPRDAASPPMLDTVLAGGVAGVASRTCTAPLDRLKTLVLLRDAFKGTQRVKMVGKNAGVFENLQMIYREGGVAGFWRGNFANCVKVVPETAVKFGVFERLKPNGGESNSNGRRFAAGAVAGMTAQAVVYPLEVIKTRIAASETGVYRGMAHCVERTVRKEGPRVMYRGLGVSLVGMIPYAGIDLAVFDWLRGRYLRRTKDTTPPVPVVLLCGIISSGVAQLVSYPLGLVRQRLQAQGMTADRPVVFSSPWHCFSLTYSKAGVRGLYAGFVPTLLKATPAAAISYASYEATKDALRRRREAHRGAPELMYESEHE